MAYRLKYIIASILGLSCGGCETESSHKTRACEGKKVRGLQIYSLFDLLKPTVSLITESVSEIDFAQVQHRTGFV